MSISSSLYLLCCILHIVKTKELASCIAAALFFQLEVFESDFDAKTNGHICGPCITDKRGDQDHDSRSTFVNEEVTEESCSSIDASLCNNSVSNQINCVLAIPLR